MIRHLAYWSALLLLVVTTRRTVAQQSMQGPSGDFAPPDTFPALHAVNTAHFDTTCAPCRDFYGYVNGGWLAHTEIPAIYAEIGVDRDIGDRTEALLHRTLVHAAQVADTTSDANTRRVGLYYASCMDTALADRQGTAPLQPELARISAIRTRSALMTEIGALQLDGVDALLSFGPIQDFANSQQMIANVYQGGLGLPDRDFYTLTDSTSRRLRRAYRTHVARVFELLGDAPAAARMHATRVVALETALAHASMNRTDQRDPHKIYHRMSRAELQALSPNLEWSAFFQAAGVPAVQGINVGQPEFVRAVNRLIVSTPLTTWQDYLRWHFAEAMAPALSTPFVHERFHFTSLITGEQELRPRWKRCLAATDGSLGEALGQEYVKTAFTPTAKARALAMVRNLEAALRERLQSLDWMSDSTKHQALAKLAAIGNKIGYPDHWRDYSALTVARAPYVANYLAANRFETAWQLGRVDKPVDRALWQMTPPTDNAYYNAFNNEIVFPAGILQPPYFDPEADDAVNYGAIGSVIGHEMTHGFDDEGRQFDAQGNLRQWWTPEDDRRFTERAQPIVDQYAGYVAVDTMHLNGRLTLGENIADIGGLKIAYAAFRKSLEGKPEPAPIDGFTADQRFFIAYTEAWRTKTRPEEQRTRAITDPHSPAKWRVNGVLAHIPAFAQAFGCKSGDPMVLPPDKQMKIW